MASSRRRSSHNFAYPAYADGFFCGQKMGSASERLRRGQKSLRSASRGILGSIPGALFTFGPSATDQMSCQKAAYQH